MNIKAYFNRSAALHLVFLLTVAALGLDIYMRLSGGGSICPTEACAIVGDFVRLDEHSLVTGGLFFFTLTWGFYFFASRYDKKWLWLIIGVLMAGALAFDGALLGFQFFSIQEQCHLCVGVGAALLLTLLLLSLVRRQVTALLLGLTIWVGGGIAGAMISIPDRAPMLEQLRPITWAGPQAGSWPVYHYFFSLHCPHCTDVMVNLAMNDPEIFTWKLYPLDTAPPDLRKLTRISELSDTDDNLFMEIVRLEQRGTVPDVQVMDGLADDIARIRSFFRANGFRGVPVMIAEESQGRRVVLTGGGNILNYLHQQGALGPPG
ncbi:hypothetical protein [Desulfonatronovibrio magnus]|uniref:hypothetical protein n=1 Tax=Desulfonatronovibrio magnus TaxID=698827 RepID=UPI0005EB1B73|nr:hypothetical protein [Desulfonatronovibrio magnus]